MGAFILIAAYGLSLMSIISTSSGISLIWEGGSRGVIVIGSAALQVVILTTALRIATSRGGVRAFLLGAYSIAVLASVFGSFFYFSGNYSGDRLRREQGEKTVVLAADYTSAATSYIATSASVWKAELRVFDAAIKREAEVGNTSRTRGGEGPMFVQMRERAEYLRSAVESVEAARAALSLCPNVLAATGSPSQRHEVGRNAVACVSGVVDSAPKEEVLRRAASGFYGLLNRRQYSENREPPTTGIARPTPPQLPAAQLNDQDILESNLSALEAGNGRALAAMGAAVALDVLVLLLGLLRNVPQSRRVDMLMDGLG